MPLPADYHMHTPLCHHASGEPTEYAAHALHVGLEEIGFSEHQPMIRDDYDDWHIYQRDLDEYVERVQKARRDHPKLTIRLALEMDYIPGQEDWIRELAAKHPWDYLIGSVHYVTETWDFDNPKKVDQWQSREVWEVWSEYFDRLTRSVESRLFDIVGHADLCKKFCHYPKQDCTPLYRRLMEAIRRTGMAMELNTAGLRKDCREIYPARPLVQLAAEYGVLITFGSDAHAVTEVGADFTAAISLAKGAGYRHWVRFAGRQQKLVSL